MSKKVTVVSKGVMVSGTVLCLCSDSTLRACYNETKKGDEADALEVAVTRKGMAAILKAAPLMAQLVDIEKKLKSIKVVTGGDFGHVQFQDEVGDLCISVGCTSVSPDEIPGYLKALGIKR